MPAAASSAGAAGVIFALKGCHTTCLQEVEAQPQQLAAVVDRSFSTVQDLIDNTACMVRIMRRSCQSDNWKYCLAKSGNIWTTPAVSSSSKLLTITKHCSSLWVASVYTAGGRCWCELGACLLHSPAFSRPPGKLLQGAPASEAAVRRLFQQLVVGLAFCHRQVDPTTCAA
jgi:hypothetical protein